MYVYIIYIKYIYRKTDEKLEKPHQGYRRNGAGRGRERESARARASERASERAREQACERERETDEILEKPDEGERNGGGVAVGGGRSEASVS
jgi:hypothetical protein